MMQKGKDLNKRTGEMVSQEKYLVIPWESEPDQISITKRCLQTLEDPQSLST